VIAVDTSIVVAGFASWHEAHASAVAVLARRPRIPAPVLIESYSVLTRLPPPHRAPAPLVAEFLLERFPQPPLALPGRVYLSSLLSAAEAGITGGGIYDALIAATAVHARARLLTRDRRAAPTYERLGVRYEIVS
jgi:predicted nucleic acid-binding protein